MGVGYINIYLLFNFHVDAERHISKVRVHMNVVPRSTGNTNSGTRELTLKCKL